ncbi:hypothetical protein KXN12_001299 [Campylobacter jejuni]|nr:hypothetical protein [Campylobacter jejuni]EJA9773788.1 hypothetical protein [Campylobacter coli]EHT8183128.1 hypothetical protein [Campylobacter jejuni]EHW0172944.1 hypothetical protein [Campylobacter jejuni]EII3042593.1 hypothetical protein [Campylobacter jejuni]
MLSFKRTKNLSSNALIAREKIERFFMRFAEVILLFFNVVFLFWCFYVFLSYRKNQKNIEDIGFKIDKEIERQEIERQEIERQEIERQEIERHKERNQFIYNDNIRAKFASMKEGKITDCYIEVSTEDLKKLDTFTNMKRPLNVIFFCKNDEQHFLFAEVYTGRDYYIKEGAEIIHEEYNIMKNIKFKGKEK